jgi:hypothetical protein
MFVAIEYSEEVKATKKLLTGFLKEIKTFKCCGAQGQL